MYCLNCGRNISNNNIYCEFCGYKIKEEKKTTDAITEAPEETSKTDKIIINKTLKQIADHLEFLGYRIEKLETQEQNNKEFITASHSKNNHIIFWEIFSNFIIFRVNLTTGKKPSMQIDAFINNANKQFDITKIYTDVENNCIVLRFEAIYIGEYSKEIFGQFYEFFENDQKRLNLLDNFSKLFLN